jgi:DNA polymerase III epsilon subunit-like protein
MLTKESIVPQQHICTMRLARALDTEGVIPKYNLQYLRYYLGIEVEATAHDALGDVLVLEKLFERLYAKVKEKIQSDNDDMILDEMIRISSEPSLIKTIGFGKHAGKKLEEVARIDPGYLEWLLAQKVQSDTNEEDWIYTLKYYLKK